MRKQDTKGDKERQLDHGVWNLHFKTYLYLSGENKKHIKSQMDKKVKKQTTANQTNQLCITSKGG